MNLNGKQIISIIISILSVLMISTAQLTDLFGAPVAKTVVSVAGLLNLILGAVMSNLTSQSNTVKDVAAMPGVDRIAVNAAANQILAQAATDPSQPKVGAVTPDVRPTLIQTAKGA